MTENRDFQYVGGELELFAQARNWKRYWRSQIVSFLEGDVLEVGAGIGNNTRGLRSDGQRRWVCLEPDKLLLAQMRSDFEASPPPARCEPVEGTLADLDQGQRFHAILYVDVLEHIPDDRAELERAASHLLPGGHLVILSPAHQWLFSKFDSAIGHFRRYTKASLLALTPAGLTPRRSRYLDSCGLWLSLGNRLLARQSLPTPKQILFWDRVVIPISRILDPLLGYAVGKSVLVVWVKPTAARP